jgi:hypothetical protein
MIIPSFYFIELGKYHGREVNYIGKSFLTFARVANLDTAVFNHGILTLENVFTKVKNCRIFTT